MMKLAVEVNARRGNLIANIIRICTRAKAFHVEPVFSDGTAFVATPSFVGLTSHTNDYDGYHWVLIDCPWMTDAEEQKQRTWAEGINIHNLKYDYLGAISGFFGAHKENSEKWYCGEICAHVFGDAIPELKKLKWCTPDKIWKIIAERTHKK